MLNLNNIHYEEQDSYMSLYIFKKMGTSGEVDSGDLWKMESLLSAGPRREKRHQ
jgi:hypothetical protein